MPGAGTNRLIATFAILSLYSLFPVRANALIPLSERQALENFYDSTNGSNWLRKDGWLGPRGSECSGSGWFGVVCNREGTHVTELKLPGNRLSGSTAALGNLANLTDLEVLNLGENSLNGSIPTALAALPNLQSLNIRRNKISGTLPVNWVTPKLSILDLSTNSLDGVIPESLGRISTLTEVRIAGNNLRGTVPTSFLQLLGANVIDLRWNALSVENALLLSALNLRSPDSDILRTQTLPPVPISAVLTGPNILTLTWRPPSYITNEGGYRITLRTASNTSLIMSVASKSRTNITLSGSIRQFSSATFETFTSPHAGNPNQVLSLQSVALAIQGDTSPERPGKITFTTPFLDVTEGETALIPLIRTEGLDGNISVLARPIEGTAGRSDFRVLSSFVAWPDGNNSLRFIPLTINSDREIEQQETFRIKLEQPTGGASLGLISETTIRILDDDISGFGIDPVAARDPAGNILVVWVGSTPNNGTAIFGRFADPAGRPEGNIFQISLPDESPQSTNPKVISIKIDHFEVAWQQKRGAVRRCVTRIREVPNLGKQAQVGVLVAPDSLDMAGDQETGRFILAWKSGARIIGRLFGEDEDDLGTFRIDGPSSGRPGRPSTSFQSGSHRLLVAWDEATSPGETDIIGRFFSDEGVAISPEFRINTHVAGKQDAARVVGNPSGFLAVWRSVPLEPFPEDPAGTEVRGLVLRPFAPTASDFRINENLLGSQEAITLTTDSNGNCLIAWLRDGSTANGLYTKNLDKCLDNSRKEVLITLPDARTIRAPNLLPAAGSIGIVYQVDDVVNGNGGVGINFIGHPQ